MPLDTIDGYDTKVLGLKRHPEGDFFCCTRKRSKRKKYIHHLRYLNFKETNFYIKIILQLLLFKKRLKAFSNPNPNNNSLLIPKQSGIFQPYEW